MKKLLRDETLLIGAGQAGTAIARLLAEEFTKNTVDVLLFNTARDIPHSDKTEVVVLKNEAGTFDGSGRNPQVTMEKILPPHTESLRKKLVAAVKPNHRVVMVISSLGGGSGSAISYHINKEILIPLKKELGSFQIVQVVIGASENDQNIVRKNELPMTRMLYDLTRDITILPIYNDRFHEDTRDGGFFEKTNLNLCRYLVEMFDVERFAGEIKENSLGSLDKNEFVNRGLAPANGFLSWTSFPLSVFDRGKIEPKHYDTRANVLDIRSAKTAVIVFKTLQGRSVSPDHIEKVKQLFPDATMIFAESQIPEGYGEVEILANGIDVSEEMLKASNDVIDEALTLRGKKKDARASNKKRLEIGKKSLFKL